MKKLIIYIILLSFTFSSCSKPNKQNIENDKNATHNKKIIATWVTYEEIKMLIDATNSKNDFINLIYEKLNVLKNYKVNTIFLHVRAFDDCFYKSDIYPVSIYCSNKDGSLKYDVLEIFINICKLLDIKLHAWVNPYRIRNDSAINKINENTLAYKFINNKSEKIIITENVIYYNPAYVDIQKYIIDGIKEILENYSVDGIHIDDYFYPTTSTMIDNSIFTSYTVSGGKLSLNDFRRRNIDSLISSIYSLVKSYGDICFCQLLGFA